MDLHRVTVLGLLATGTFLAYSFCAAQSPGDAQKLEALQKPGRLPDLIEMDFDKAAVGKNEIEVHDIGAIIKIFAKRPNGRDPTKKSIKTLRTEITGDAVEKIVIVSGQSRIGQAPDLHSQSDADFACFLSAKRGGAAKVKITIIEADGKPGESKEWKIIVSEPKVQEKKASGSDDPLPQQLVYGDIVFHVLKTPVDLRITRPGAEVGSMVQLEYDCPADKTHKRYVETMKIEDIKGDSVRFLNAVATEYPGNEGKRRRICCYAISTKPGTTTFKITAIGPNGEPVLERRVVSIHVGPSKKKTKFN